MQEAKIGPNLTSQADTTGLLWSMFHYRDAEDFYGFDQPLYSISRNPAQRIIEDAEKTLGKKLEVKLYKRSCSITFFERLAKAIRAHGFATYVFNGDSNIGLEVYDPAKLTPEELENEEETFEAHRRIDEDNGE